MKTLEEKRWERMQQLLLAESRGDAPARICSQRNLFGIKCSVDEVIEGIVQKEEQRLKEERRAAKSKGQAPDSDCP